MIPFDLSGWFRRRMLPLVLCASLLVLFAAPLSYHLTKRRELWQEARAGAHRVAAVLRGEIERRPLLWRYDMPKLAERLAEEGLSGVAQIVIRDGDGVAVPLDVGPRSRAPARALLWGRVEVMARGAQAATVWVATDGTPLVRGTAWLAAVFTLLSAVLGAVLYLLPMRAIAAAQRRIAALLGQLTLTLQEEDRRRIARDLHDGAGQALTAARLRLLAVERQAASGPVAGAALEEIGRLLDEATGEVRRSAYALAPPALAELGLLGALSRHCEAFAGATGLSVRCEVDPALGELPAPIETACYRMVQEALSNCARHAGAKKAIVSLVREGALLHLTVADDGDGPAKDLREGQGLLGIRQRAQLLSGTAFITAPEGQGMRIDVRLPIEQ